MFLWRKSAEPPWVKAHEDLLQADADGQLVIVRRPGRKLLQLEIACNSRSRSRALLKQFGGRVEKFPRGWLERFMYGPKSKPLKIGKRLLIFNVGGTLVSRVSRHKGRSHIVIPASRAFGTGEHATTAMSLHLLEQLTRGWKRGWSLVDLGTGSGILALAAKRFGAGHVVGMDNDPTAISTAKSNARLNKIHGVVFRLGDVLKREWPRNADVITANLYSHLLIEIVPKSNPNRWLIFSGILRSQKDALLRALQRNDIEIRSIKHRGKWIAVLAYSSGAVRVPELPGPKVLRRSQTADTVKIDAK